MSVYPGQLSLCSSEGLITCVETETITFSSQEQNKLFMALFFIVHLTFCF